VRWESGVPLFVRRKEAMSFRKEELKEESWASGNRRFHVVEGGSLTTRSRNRQASVTKRDETIAIGHSGESKKTESPKSSSGKGKGAFADEE